jgi:pyruvate formate lyase activating enzyme
LSTEDGPGIRTTVFFKECPLKCVWCHNPESILKVPSVQWFKAKCIGCENCVIHCPSKALKLDKDGLHIDRTKCQACGTCAKECPSTAIQLIGKWWDLETLFKEIYKDKAFYDKSGGGITVSGGEPTMQLDYVVHFLKKCKENGLSTALDTCGLTSKASFEQLLPYVDLILFDIKEIDSDKHKQFTGVPNEIILENAKWLVKKIQGTTIEFWVRTPLIPGHTATETNIRGIAQFILKELGNRIHRWDLLAFNNLAKSKYERMDLDWPLKSARLLAKENILDLYEIAKSSGVNNVNWSGLTRPKTDT